LKAHALWYHAVLAQCLEHEIGVRCVLGVAEAIAGIAEAHGVDARFHLELPDVVTAPRHELFHAINPRRPLDRLEIDVAVENLVRQAQHPGAAFADLAVRDRRQVTPERSAKRPHHVFDRLERNTTYQQQFLTHSSTRLCDRI
jgi:hypothetical protein